MSYGYGYTGTEIVSWTSGTTHVTPVQQTIAVASSAWGWKTIFKNPGPMYGWYREFEPWPHLKALCRPLLIDFRPVRGQARGCSKNARRWKRRRFLHALRRAA